MAGNFEILHLHALLSNFRNNYQLAVIFLKKKSQLLSSGIAFESHEDKLFSGCIGFIELFSVGSIKLFCGLIVPSVLIFRSNLCREQFFFSFFHLFMYPFQN